jgi:hypothetical protein
LYYGGKKTCYYQIRPYNRSIDRWLYKTEEIDEMRKISNRNGSLDLEKLSVLLYGIRAEESTQDTQTHRKDESHLSPLLHI